MPALQPAPQKRTPHPPIPATEQTSTLLPAEDRIRRVRTAFRGGQERERQRLEGSRRHTVRPRTPAADASPRPAVSPVENLAASPVENVAESLAVAWSPRAAGLRLRTPLPERACEPDSRTALAMEAEELLGYAHLRRQVHAPSRLERLLARLAIAVYDPLSVAEYKASLLAVRRAAEGEGPRPAWQSTPLTHYGRPIPEPLLRRCVEIRRHAAEARFFVEELPEAGPDGARLLAVSLGGSAAGGPGTPDEERAYLVTGAGARGSEEAEPFCRA